MLRIYWLSKYALEYQAYFYCDKMLTYKYPVNSIAGSMIIMLII